MAEHDLDAALQLLAERAQYITGASGAAIALRRGSAHDMLCRASAGSNAPELGALLSTEYGLSGESVRTRQALRCDDAERDSRVNRDGCRQLGIASVVIMPIIGDEEVMGVFELFSGKPSAFNERDLAALERLGRMVETAVKHAIAFQTHLEISEFLQVDPQPQAEPVKPKAMAASASATPMSAPAAAKVKEGSKRPLFWSAAVRAQDTNRPAGEAKPLAIPPVLRQLQKCRACGFPVSTGRTFCVDCEGKQLRGQRLQQPAQGPEVATGQGIAHHSPHSPDSTSLRDASEHFDAAARVALADANNEVREPVNSASNVLGLSPETAGADDNAGAELVGAPSPDIDTPFLSSALAPSQSWFATNKYVVGAIVVVAIVIAALVWLR